jgi:hypothetical protein
MAAERDRILAVRYMIVKERSTGYQVVLNEEQTGYRQGRYFSAYTMHGYPNMSMF